MQAAAPNDAPPASGMIERGAYLAELGDCGVCHTAKSRYIQFGPQMVASACRNRGTPNAASARSVRKRACIGTDMDLYRSPVTLHTWGFV